MRRKTDENAEEILEGQIPEFQDPQPTIDPEIGRVGGKLLHKIGDAGIDNSELKETIAEKKLSGLGTNIRENVQVRDGWMHCERELLGERSVFYPEDWEFYIRPATVDAIRNWSTVDEENSANVDDVFNEILKACLSIRTPNGPKPWNSINSWDRFFFVLLVREYTFKKGESKIEFEEECANCDALVKFTLDSQSLMYDMPGSDVMQYYDPESRSWMIDPSEYDIDEDRITFYNPTVEKDANIKAWMIERLQENRKFKIDPAFIKFLSWMAPKISKDSEIAKRQIREYQLKYKSWDIDTYVFFEDVIKNISVTPATTLRGFCESCGEEATARVRFPNGVSDLFNFKHKSRKFGSK